MRHIVIKTKYVFLSESLLMKKAKDKSDFINEQAKVFLPS